MPKTDYSPIDIEKGIVGAVIADSTIYPAVAGSLKLEYFQVRSMRMLWESITEMAIARKVIDVMTLVEHMGPEKVSAMGGQAVVIDALDTVFTLENVQEYAALLEERWRERELAKYLQSTLNVLKSDGYQAAYDAIQSDLISLSQHGKTAGFTGLSELVANWFISVEEIRANPELKQRTYLPTGFVDYDEAYGGLPNGLNILAGRPAMGKTSLAINVAMNAARQGKSVLFFSLEMSQTQLVTRVLSSLCKIDSRRLEQGEIQDAEIGGVLSAVDAASGLDIELDENATELNQIISQIENWRLLRGKNPDLVVIDYLGLIRVSDIRGDGAERRAVGRVVSELSVYFTKELRAPLLMLCQLNRAVEARQNKRPTLADLRDSGEIEQAAARVDFVYRDAYYYPDSQEQNVGELITAKNRFGGNGTVKLYFEPETTTFHNLAK